MHETQNPDSDLRFGLNNMSDYQITVGDTEIAVTSVTNAVSVYNILCNVIRDDKVNSSEGQSVTPVAIVTNMPGHIKWLSGREQVLFNKQTHILDGILHCRVPVGVTIVNTNRILYNGDYYNIVDIRDFRNLGVLLEIALRKVK